MRNGNEDRNIEIKEGNYVEYLEGNYIQNNYIKVDHIPKPIGFPQNIPRSSTDKFVGRQKELETLHQQLQDKEEVTIAHLEGMGGIGKTELAIAYSLLSLKPNTYPGGICWLRARDEDIASQIVSFAQTKLNLTPPDNLDLPDKVSWCWSNWNQGTTLIVLDDVTNYRKIKPYLPPQASQFKVLITTRLKLDLDNPLFLEVLSESEALELLSQLIGSEKVNQELATAKELCQRLGYLPLALQLVGRYVRKRKISLNEELQRLEAKGLVHPSMKVPENDPSWTMDINLGVKAAFELSWEELSKPAQKLGCLLSLFALAPIPWQLVKSTAFKKDRKKLEAARVQLENLHLLQSKGNYQLHQLIQEFFRNKQKNLTNTDKQKSNFCNAMGKIAYKAPEIITVSDSKFLKPFIPHLIETATIYQNWLDNDDLFNIFIHLASYYKVQGDYTKALPWFKQCLSVTRKRFGEKNTYVATSLNLLALFYIEQGRYEEAESLLLQSLELNKELLGELHPNVIQNRNNLVTIYTQQGRYKKAESLSLRVLRLRKLILGKEHPHIATSLQNLGVIYRKQGRYEEAESLLLQSLGLFKELLGEEHPRVAYCLHELAGIYKDQGRYEEAESLLLQSLGLLKKLLGKGHPHITDCLHELARSYYYEQGRYAKAETFYLELLELQKMFLGEKDFELTESINNLGVIYKKQGRYEEAEPLFLQALGLFKKLLGEEHPVVAGSLNNLAGIYKDQGRYEEAESLYLQALDLREKLLGKEHPDVAQSLNNLAVLYDLQEKYEEAETLYLQALNLRKKLLGEEHPDVAESLNNLALFYKEQGRYEEAEPLLLQALGLFKKLLGEGHPDVACSLDDLARLYTEQGRYEEAEPLLLQALELNKELLGKEHPDVAYSFCNLARIYHVQGKYSEAEPLYIQALKIAEKVLGKNHPDTITIQKSYELLKKQQK